MKSIIIALCAASIGICAYAQDNQLELKAPEPPKIQTFTVSTTNQENIIGLQALITALNIKLPDGMTFEQLAPRYGGLTNVKIGDKWVTTVRILPAPTQPH